MIEINRNPSPRILRQFSVAAGVFAALVGCILLARGASWTACGIAWTIGAAVMLAGLASPASVRWVYIGLSLLAAPIGIVVSLSVLGIVYYVVVTPIGLLTRLLGRDPMQKHRDPNADTYWKERTAPEPDRYFRQF